MPPTDSHPARPCLRWLQYSLSSLFLVMLLACIRMSWIGGKIRAVRRQKKVVDAPGLANDYPLIYSCGGFGYTTAMNETRKPRRRRFQYSLRSLFVLMFLACVGMSWVGVKMQKARKQKEAVEAIKKLGGQVQYDYEVRRPGNPPPGAGPPGPTWLRKLLGDDLFTTVVNVVLFSSSATDADLEHLTGLTQLQMLNIRNTKVTTAGLVHLKGLAKLNSLALWDTKVTDAGLESLKELTQLQELVLFGTKVTGCGFEHLKRLTKLQTLNLGNTQVTDAGLVHLKELIQLQTLDLGGTEVTDAGLVHLKGLTKLQTLDLNKTQVTDAGLVHLSGLKQLQTLDLFGTQVTDAGLEHLEGLTQLHWVDLGGTRVTDEGAEETKTGVAELK